MTGTLPPYKMAIASPALQDIFEFPVRSVALASDARDVSFRKIPLRKGAVDKR
jgi:hypothetical protein